jgi:integrase
LIDSQHTSNSKSTNAEALAALLDASGVDAAVLAAALQSIATAAKVTAPPEGQQLKVYLNKELVYEDETAYIYQRNDTKQKFYYLRIWDKKSKKPFIKSLETRDRIKAITAARLIYQEVKGKIDRGERVRNITTTKLVEIYLEIEALKITDIPRQGITKGRYRTKEYFCKKWLKYIEELGFATTPIDKIKPHSTRRFGYWLMQQPKGAYTNSKSPRSIEMINNTISEIKKIYKDVAVRDRYIGKDQVPEIDRLREQPDEGHKRDILSLEQYEKLWKYMEYTYCKDKSVSGAERAKRVIFSKFIGVMYNTGMRCKEVLGLRVNEVYSNPLDDEESKKKNMLVKIRSTNSKTGKSRIIAAPIKTRIDAIKKMQQQLGVELQPTDYLFMNAASGDRKHYTREAMANRLRRVLKDSGLQEELDREGKVVNLYSARHTWFTWRLRYGNVPIHLLAEAGGNSVAEIMKSYAKISIEKQADVLTRAQGFAKMAEVDLTVGLYNSEDD